MDLKITEQNEAGEPVADLSPPKKPRTRPQPEDKVPTDPNLPPIGTDIWLCEGGVWATKPRKVDRHGVTSNGDAFQVEGYSMWLLMKHEGECWSRKPVRVAVEHEDIRAAFDSVAATIPTTAFPTGKISHNAEERALPIPGTEPPDPTEPSKKLEFTRRRHQSLTPHISTLVDRVRKWDIPDGWDSLSKAIDTLDATWTFIGVQLTAAKIAGMQPKVTARSRLRSWLRPGASVALRDDIAKDYAQLYSAEELANLEVQAVLETKVAVRVRGGRELGLVELAHVRKP